MEKKIKLGFLVIVPFVLMGFVSPYIKNDKEAAAAVANYVDVKQDFNTLESLGSEFKYKKLSEILGNKTDRSLFLDIKYRDIDYDAMQILKVSNPVSLDYIKNKKGMPDKHDLNYISKIYNLPEDLLFSIMMKESRGNPNAVSHKEARGAFQFMRQTAYEFGLFRNGKDLRNNPWLSADAAARYIKWLFLYVTPEKDSKDIKNYTYTLAAYNAGIARVKRNGSVYIPNIKETQDYVSKIMGHLEGEKYIVKIGDDLEKIASAKKTTVKEIQRLNNGIRDHQLKYGNFINVKAPEISGETYIVKKGDTLGKIANLTGVDLYTIKEENSIKGDIIYVGQAINIP